MISDKVKPHHLERKALLYVRQSLAQQVLHNRESSTLQYAMRDRLSGYARITAFRCTSPQRMGSSLGSISARRRSS